MHFVDKIFREYDVRGVYGKDYDADFASLLAKAAAQFLRASAKPLSGNRFRFAVGRDARPSGDLLTPKFISSLIEEGFEVIELGIVPTPLVYFSLFHLKVDAAVSITGSHNATEYNGFKICIGKSTLHGSQIQELKSICTKLKSGSSEKSNTAGSSSTYDIIAPYIQDVTSRVKLKRPLKVVVDSGNGAGCVVGPQLLEKLGCTVLPLYCDLDGTFPNHHPDPTVLENLVDLQKLVLKEKADIGIAYDGDADRIGVVDEKGRPIFGDEQMILYSKEILSRKPGSKILFEVKCSNRLANEIKKNGGTPIMWKTGHSLIKAKMKEEGAELAGEMSGHMFFADRYYGYDDAIYASARMLEILSSQDIPLSQHLAHLPQSFSTPELRIDCEDEIKFDVVKEVAKEFATRFKVIEIDGVRIETDDGWGLLRASNTQPAVVMRFEATTQKRLDELKSIVESSFEVAKNAVKKRAAK